MFLGSEENLIFQNRNDSFQEDDMMHKDDTNVSDAEEETIGRKGPQQTSIKDFPTNQGSMGSRDILLTYADNKMTTTV